MRKLKNLNFNIFTVNLIIILSLVGLFEGGFDHNIVYYMLLISTISLIGYSRYDKKDIYISKSNPLIYLGLFIVWSGLSFIWTIHYTRTLIEFLQLSLYGIVFLMTLKLDDENKEKVQSIVILIATLLALLGILEYTIVKTGRIVSTFTNPNPFATYLTMIFLYTWGLTLRKNTLTLHISSTMLLTALFLTGSRGGFIALALAIGFIFIGLERKELYKSIFKTMLLILFSLLLMKGIMTLAPLLQENLRLNNDVIGAIIRKNSFLSSTGGRFEFWKVAGKVALLKPLTGFGLGTFFTSYYLGYVGNRWFSRFTHNHYLQLISEIGIIGLILFLFFLAVCFYHIFKRLKKKNYPTYLPGAIAGVVAFLMHIGIEFSFNFPGVTVIFFYLLAISVGDIEKEEKKLENKEKIFKLNYKFKHIIVTLLFLTTVWHLSSLYLYDYSVKLINEEKIEESNKVLTFINSYYPINSVGYAFKSENYQTMYIESKDIEYLNLAIEYMREATKRAPMDGKLYNKLGNLYLESGDIKLAEENLRLGIEYGIYPLNRYIDLANFYIDQNKYQDAEEVLLKGIKISPYAIGSAGSQEKETATFNTSILHTRLYYIYKQTNNHIGMNEQRQKMMEVTEDYKILREYFLNIMESY